MPKRVSFVTSYGKRVSFSSSKKKYKAPSHLKVYNNKMKQLSYKYQNGEFGDMSWREVIETYMSNDKPKHKSRRKSINKSFRLKSCKRFGSKKKKKSKKKKSKKKKSKKKSLNEVIYPY